MRTTQGIAEKGGHTDEGDGTESVPRCVRRSCYGWRGDLLRALTGHRARPFGRGKGAELPTQVRAIPRRHRFGGGAFLLFVVLRWRLHGHSVYSTVGRLQKQCLLGGDERLHSAHGRPVPAPPRHHRTVQAVYTVSGPA